MNTFEMPDFSEPGMNGMTDQLLKLLVDQTPSGVAVLESPSARPLLGNRRIAEIWGIPDLCDGQSLPDLQGNFPDGRPLEPQDWPHYQALQGKKIEDREIQIVCGDGSTRLVKMSATPLTRDDGGVRAVLLTCVDISGQRRHISFRRLLHEARLLLSSSNDPVASLRELARLIVPDLADWCTIDLCMPTGTLKRVATAHADRERSVAAAELGSRYVPSEEADFGVGRAVRTGEPELVTQATPAVLDRWAQSDRHRELIEELGAESMMFIPLVAHDMVMGAMALVAGDSGRRYTEEDLEVAEEVASLAALALENQRLLEESQAANTAKSDFLAVMSHELRTPLTAIIGYSELLQLGVPEPVTPRQHEQAERIEVSARHLLKLIEEILMLVSLDSGDDRVRHQEVRINEVIESVASIVEPMATAKGIELRISRAEQDPTFRSDHNKLIQILLSLLSNAVKFTDHGEVELSTHIDGEQVTFEVRDTGIGVAPEHCDRIFDPFWQAERPITRKAGGTGLGLTIAHRLTDTLGGTIGVKSIPEGGSLFRVTLPLSTPE